ncbi:LysR substrate-binding domain-containing protein [Streptomyces sp. NBC_01190]|uniref:LysR substrate-binding domain-containing protein n=1 Tax=Streptomyces sp. NBC_01190 TaxID=2903767 RepID=UPI003865B242|nr:LysR substrate-binding domain-containing protein [Streptomyces sp. NBC_01190]
MLDVRRLRLLRELSSRGTIAAVAEALAFTPSAVSQQLSALEREAGVPLLERTGRRVVLTPAARGLVRHAEAVLERLEQAAAELAGARDGLAGPLRIGTFPSAARVMVPAALTALAARHPGLEPMVSEIDPARVGGALRAGDLDVALIHAYDFVPLPAEPGLATEPLCTESMYLASMERAGGVPGGSGGSSGGAGGVGGTGGAGGPVDGTAHSARDAVIGLFRDAPWITASPGTLCRTMTVRACQAAGFTPRIRHQVDDFAAVLALVAAGQGVAVVPRLAVVDAVPAVTLTRLPIRRRTMIAFRAGAGRHPAVTATATAFRDAVPPDLLGGP